MLSTGLLYGMNPISMLIHTNFNSNFIETSAKAFKYYRPNKANSQLETTVIEYRSFRNPDPPEILRLWNECDLGRGAAKDFPCDALESLSFSQPYFDPKGLILAVQDERIVGFIHAGFEPHDSKSKMSTDIGVICALMVHPEFRRQGIAKQLLQEAIKYYAGKDTTQIYAGASAGRDPFYVGLYGGSRPSGFLKSDDHSDVFFNSVGFEPHREFGIFQRNLHDRKDPINIRVLGLRRKYEVQIIDQPADANWWWFTRFGRLETLRFNLVPKNGGDSVAAISVVGLDLFLPTWKERSIGLFDLHVEDDQRRKGFAQLLVLEVLKRMREELFSVAEMHVPIEDERLTGLMESCRFEQIDSGLVYKLTDK